MAVITVPTAENVFNTLGLRPHHRSAFYWMGAAEGYERRRNWWCAACAWAAAYYAMPSQETLRDDAERCVRLDRASRAAA